MQTLAPEKQIVRIWMSVPKVNFKVHSTNVTQNEGCHKERTHCFQFYKAYLYNLLNFDNGVFKWVDIRPHKHFLKC